MAERKANSRFCGALLCLTPAAEAIIYGVLREASLTEIVRLAVWVLVLGGILLVYRLVKPVAAEADRHAGQWVTAACMIASVPFAMLCTELDHIPFFLLGAVLAAALADLGDGLALLGCLSAVCLLYGAAAGSFVLPVTVLGFVYCLLAGWLRGIKNTCCALVTGEAMTAVIILLTLEFGAKPAGQPDLRPMLFVCAAALLLAALLRYVRERYFMHEKRTAGRVANPGGTEAMVYPEGAGASEELAAAGRTDVLEGTGVSGEELAAEEIAGAAAQLAAAAEEGTAVQTGEGRPAPGRRDDGAADKLPRETLRQLVGEEAGLLRRLRETMPEQFAHTGRIAEVSTRAAACIGADELFCEAVAWYREIGKLEEQSDFSASGEHLMREADMPEELISSARMAGMKNAAAKNRETAVVMLTANVITEIEAAKPGKAKDRKAKQGRTDISPDRMVDNVFLVRLIRGTLDESGLTVRDYSRLRQFFLAEFGFQEKQKKGE